MAKFGGEDSPTPVASRLNLHSRASLGSSKAKRYEKSFSERRFLSGARDVANLLYKLSCLPFQRANLVVSRNVSIRSSPALDAGSYQPSDGPNSDVLQPKDVTGGATADTWFDCRNRWKIAALPLMRVTQRIEVLWRCCLCGYPVAFEHHFATAQRPSRPPADNLHAAAYKVSTAPSRATTRPRLTTTRRPGRCATASAMVSASTSTRSPPHPGDSP